MNWLKYLLEANLYLVAFYALYYLIFRRETYYQFNRFYLLGSTALSFIIPLIQIGMLNPPAVQLQNVVITTINSPILAAPIKAITDTSWPLSNYLLLAYTTIAFLLLISLAFKIYKLIGLSYSNKTVAHSTFKLVELPGENNAFSFFNYLFISPRLKYSSTIINHELIHIRQKHSWDIIYLELLKVINWFNPVIWLMQISLKEVHEFIADNHTVNNEANPAAYTDFLVSSAYGIMGNTLTNTFFNKSLLKKRIMMLHQKKSGNAARLKYLLILPLICGLLCASTLVFAKSYSWIDLAPRYNSPTSLSATNNSHKVYRLKFTSGNNSFITDKISFKDNNGKLKIFTVNSLTEKDKEYLLKTQHVKLEVIEVESNSPKNKKEISDTIVQKNAPKLVVRRKIDSVNKNIRLKVKREIDTVRAKYSKTPPSPPTPPAARVANPASKTPPPPAPAVKSGQKSALVKFPPPSYWDSAIGNLGDHLRKNVHYPTSAMTSGITGNVIAQFTINNDHSITDIKIIDGIGYRCDEEVERVLKSFKGTINKDTGEYILDISFNLIDESGKKSYVTKPADPQFSGKPNFLGDIQVYAYL